MESTQPRLSSLFLHLLSATLYGALAGFVWLVFFTYRLPDAFHHLLLDRKTLLLALAVLALKAFQWLWGVSAISELKQAFKVLAANKPAIVQFLLKLIAGLGTKD